MTLICRWRPPFDRCAGKRQECLRAGAAIELRHSSYSCGPEQATTRDQTWITVHSRGRTGRTKGGRRQGLGTADIANLLRPRVWAELRICAPFHQDVDALSCARQRFPRVSTRARRGTDVLLDRHVIVFSTSLGPSPRGQRAMTNTGGVSRERCDAQPSTTTTAKHHQRNADHEDGRLGCGRIAQHKSLSFLTSNTSYKHTLRYSGNVFVEGEEATGGAGTPTRHHRAARQWCRVRTAIPWTVEHGVRFRGMVPSMNNEARPFSRAGPNDARPGMARAPLPYDQAIRARRPRFLSRRCRVDVNRMAAPSRCRRRCGVPPFELT